MTTTLFDRVAAQLTGEPGRAVCTLQTSDLMARIVPALMQLLEEPDEIKLQYRIDRSMFERDEAQREQGADHGLVRKDGKTIDGNGDRQDDKYYLHYRPGLYEVLSALKVDHLEYYSGLFRDCDELYRRNLQFIFNLAAALDRQNPRGEFLGKMSARFAMPQHVLRLLAYQVPKTQLNTMIGDSHIDRCTITLHDWDSRPGLFMRDPVTREWIPYTAEQDQVLVFASGKAPLIDGRMRMLEHAILDNDSVGKPMRIAAIFFAHTDTPIHPSLVKTRRLDAKPPVSAQLPLASASAD